MVSTTEMLPTAPQSSVANVGGAGGCGDEDESTIRRADAGEAPRPQGNSRRAPRSLKRNHGLADAAGVFAPSAIFAEGGWARARRPPALSKKGPPSSDPEVVAAHKRLRAADARRRGAAASVAAARARLEEARREEDSAGDEFRSAREAYAAAERKDPAGEPRGGRRRERDGEMLARLEAYHGRHGHADLPRATEPVPEGEPLGRAELAAIHAWVQSKKWYFRDVLLNPKHGRKTYSPHQFVVLQRLGVFEGKWEKSFRRLKAFRDRYGHADVPTKPTKWFDDKKLCNWVGTQRESYRSLNDPNPARQSQLTQGRIELLESVGFRWNVGKQRKALREEAMTSPAVEEGCGTGKEDYEGK